MTQGMTGSNALTDYLVKTANYQVNPGERLIAEHATPATRLTFTLPVICAAGATMTFKTGANTGGFKIAQNSGQSIKMPNQVSTTVGVGGFLNTNAWNPSVVQLVCITANTTFEATYATGKFVTDAATTYVDIGA